MKDTESAEDLEPKFAKAQKELAELEAARKELREAPTAEPAPVAAEAKSTEDLRKRIRELNDVVNDEQGGVANKDQIKEMGHLRKQLQALRFIEAQDPIEHLKKLSNEIRRQFPKDSGGREKLTIEEHTRMVLEIFRNEFDPHQAERISEELGFSIVRLMEYTIALHDIGKGRAIKAGDRARQHKFTVPLLKKGLRMAGFTNPEIALAVELANNDILGDVLNGRISARNAKKSLDKHAARAGVSSKTFMELQTLFYKSDAASYPQLRQRLFKKLDGKLLMGSIEFAIIEEWIYGTAFDYEELRNAGRLDPATRREEGRRRPAFLHGTATLFGQFDPSERRERAGRSRVLYAGPGAYLLNKRDAEIAEYYARRGLKRAIRIFNSKTIKEITKALRRGGDSNKFKELIKLGQAIIAQAEKEGNRGKADAYKGAVNVLKAFDEHRLGQYVLSVDFTPKNTINFGAYGPAGELTGGRVLDSEDKGAIISQIKKDIADGRFPKEKSQELADQHAREIDEVAEAEGNDRAFNLYRAIREWGITKDQINESIQRAGFDSIRFIHPVGNLKLDGREKPYEVIVVLNNENATIASGNMVDKAETAPPKKTGVEAAPSEKVEKPKPFTIENIKKQIRKAGGVVTTEQLRAVFALMETISSDPEDLFKDIFITQAERAPRGALRQVEEAVEYSEEHYEKTSNEDVFFQEIWPEALRRSGRPIQALTRAGNVSQAAIEQAAENAINDIDDYLRDNPHHKEYYAGAARDQKQILTEVFPELENPETWMFYQILQGIASPRTNNDVAPIETIDMWNNFRDTGRIDVEVDERKDSRGRTTYGLKRAGFTIRGGSRGVKAVQYTGINKLLDKFDNDIGKVVEYLIESVDGTKGLQEFRRKDLGKGPQNGTEQAKIKVNLLQATGQTEKIPRIFGLGPKVGEYALSLIGAEQFATVDIWEERFARSYFKEGIDDSVVGIDFQKVIKEFGDRIAKKLNLTPSAAQAVRWFYIKDAVRRAGYTEGSRSDSPARVSEKYLKDRGNAGVRIGARAARKPSLFRGAKRRSGRGGSRIVRRVAELLRVNPNIFYQRVKGVTRAAVEFLEDGKAIIYAIANTDLLSLLHEIGHVLRRRLLSRNVPLNKRRGITNEQIKTLEIWAGADDGIWNTEAEEKFANAWVQYLRDGTSPRKDLDDLFDKISKWLTSLSRMISSSSSEIDIPDNIREIFDRVFIGEDSIHNTPQIDAAAVLKDAKIVVEKTTTDRGKPVWNVSGKGTFDNRKTLRGLGGRWYDKTKVWGFYGEDPSQKIANAINKEPTDDKTRGAKPPDKKGSTSRERDDKAVGRKRQRDAEDRRSDRTGSDRDFEKNVSRNTRQLVERGLKYGIPKKVIQEQLEDISLAKGAFKRNEIPLFLIASEAGTGKTFVLGGIIRELRDLGAKKFVYVTMRQELIKQIKGDLADYGVEDVAFHTYAKLGDANVDEDTVVIYDESQVIKNPTSGVGEIAGRQMRLARMSVLASATPFENPVQAKYLEPTGVFDEVGGHAEWAEIYGASVKLVHTTDSRTGQEVVHKILTWRGGREKKKDLFAAREWLRKKGVFTQRKKKLDPDKIDLRFRLMEIDQSYTDLLEKLSVAYARANLLIPDRNQWKIKRHAVNLYKKVLEASKVDHVLGRVQQLIDSEKQVVIFMETKANRHIGRFRKMNDATGDLYEFPVMKEMMEEWSREAEMARSMNEKPPRRPFSDEIFAIAQGMFEVGLDHELVSVPDMIKKRFGKKVVFFTGNQTPATGQKNIAKWKNNEVPILAATMEKGGTGLSLHDTTGTMPQRVQLQLTLPWTATKVDQVSGRLARYGISDKVGIEWFFAGNVEFERELAARIGGRMIDMGAIIHGETVPAAETIEDFDFEDNFDPRKNQVVGKDAINPVEELYRKAENLERKRGKPRDKSNDFSPTPYPLAVLMQRMAGVVAGDSVLVPSAGDGSMIRFLPDGVNVTAIEEDRRRADRIKTSRPGANIVVGDFLKQYQEEGKMWADVILMNPPFTRDKKIGPLDAAHVRYAYDHLKLGGRMISIMGERVFTSGRTFETEFRDWLDEVGATVIDLPDAAFKRSGTRVKARMVIIDKGANPGRSNYQLADAEYTSLRGMEGLILSRVKQPEEEPEVDVVEPEAVPPVEAPPVQPATAEPSLEEWYLPAELGEFDIGELYLDELNRGPIEPVRIPDAIIRRAQLQLFKKPMSQLTDEEMIKFVRMSMVGGLTKNEAVARLENAGMKLDVKTEMVTFPRAGKSPLRKEMVKEWTLRKDQDTEALVKYVREHAVYESKMPVELLAIAKGEKPSWVKDVLKQVAMGRPVDSELVDVISHFRPDWLEEKELSKWRKAATKKEKEKEEARKARLAFSMSREDLKKMVVPDLKKLAKDLGVWRMGRRKDSIIDAILKAVSETKEPAAPVEAPPVQPTPAERPTKKPFKKRKKKKLPKIHIVSEGEKTEIEQVKGDSIPARYAVVPLRKLIASHDFSKGAPRKRGRYPDSLQPRDYSPGNHEAMKVVNMAMEGKAAFYISDHPAADSGPPSVTPDGIVINGNGRVMSLQYAAYEMGGYDWYKSLLIKNAKKFGLDPRKVKAEDHPVLVRIVEMDANGEEAQKFAVAGNIPTTQAQTPVRFAESISRLLDLEIIESLKLNEDTTFTEAVASPSKPAQQFRSSLYEHMVPQTRSNYFDSERKLTESGVELVRNMLMLQLFDIETVENLSGRARLKNTLERAIPQILKLKRDSGIDISPQLNQAVSFIVRNPDIKSMQHASDYLGQGTLEFGTTEKLSPATLMMMEFVYLYGGQSLKFRTRLANFIVTLREGTGLFAEPDETPASIAAKELGVDERAGAKFGKESPPGGGGAATEAFRADASRVTAMVKPITPKDAEPEGVFDRTDRLRGIQVPELVDLAKAILGGKLPQPSRRLRSSLGIFGHVEYVPEHRRILLRPDLAKNASMLARVLAHEIGHAIDYMSDFTMKRGNILGRVATLRKYFPHTLPGKPGGEAAITEADRKILRKQAWEDAGTAGFKGKARDSEAKLIYEDLLKEEIENRHLLENQTIRDELIDLTKWWSGDYSGKAASYRESSRELYAEAMSVFLNSPGELRHRAPEFWRGLIEYFDRKPEVIEQYMDIQVAMATDGKLAERRKADIYKMFGSGDSQFQAAAGARSDAEKNSTSAIIQYLFSLTLEKFHAVTSPARKAMRREKKAKAPSAQSIAKAEAAYYTLDELHIKDNENNKLLRRMSDEVHEPLLEADIHRNDMGMYLFMTRAMAGDRMEYMNPKGYTEKEARDMLVDLRKTLGADRYQLLGELATKFHDIIHEVAERAVESGVYSRKTFDEVIVPNKDTYATFAIVKYLKDTVPAGIFQQVGTFEDSANPYDATMMKMVTLNRLIRLNEAKRVAVEFFRDEFGEDSAKRVPIPHRAKEPAGQPRPGHGWIILLEDGRPVAYEVDKYVARIFEHPNILLLDMFIGPFRKILYTIWHPLYVTYNLGFQAKNLLISDLRRTWILQSTRGSARRKELINHHMERGLTKAEATALADPQRITFGDVWREYTSAKTWSAAKARGWGLSNETINEMSEHLALGVPFASLQSELAGAGKTIIKFPSKKGGLIEEVGPAEVLMRAAGVFKEEEQEKQKTIRGRAIQAISNALQSVENASIMLEGVPKVATWKLLRERGVPEREAAWETRNNAGTPNYLRRGEATGITNSLCMYSNVSWQGLRADLDVGFDPKTAAGFWTRHMIVNVMPTILSKAAKYGFLGTALHKAYQAIPSYFIDNYITLPVGWLIGKGLEVMGLGDDDDDEQSDDEPHKVVFLTIPKDETGRLASTITGKAIDVWAESRGLDTPYSSTPEALTELMREISGAVIPSLSPPLDIGHKWYQFSQGTNPIDSHYGEQIVPKQKWDVAGGWPAQQKMLAWTVGKFGELNTILHPISGPLLGAAYDPSEEAWRETTLRSVPGINRFLRISDRGLTEVQWAEVMANQQEDARFRHRLPKEAKALSKNLYLLSNRNRSSMNDYDRDRKKLLSVWNTTYRSQVEAMKAADAAGDQNHFDKLYKEMEQDAINVDQFTKELRKNMLKHAYREMPKVKGPRDFNYKKRLEQWRYNRKDAQDWLRRH